ncbi:MAG: ABC transporter permease [Candidatus Wallbacteria bacterium]|nr:ABC transporter permease [Candidatus Wallbacteria bacterium]
MKAFLVLVRLRLGEVRRSRAAALVHFGLPMALLLVTSALFLDGHPFERRRLAVVASEGLPAQVEARLAEFPELRVTLEASEPVAFNKLTAHSVQAVLLCRAGRCELLASSRDRLLARALQGLLPAGSTVRTVPVDGKAYLRYLFPGLLTWTIVIEGLFGMGYAMAHYRGNQFLRKLATTPLTKFWFVSAQIVARATLALVQIGLMTVAARLAFDLPVTPAGALWLAGLGLCGLLTFIAAGFALACLVRTEVNLMDTINAVAVVVVLTSEFFFPADELPGPLPALSSALPSTQLVRMLRAILLHGDTTAATLGPGLLVLTAWTVATGAVSLRAFRWHD